MWPVRRATGARQTTQADSAVQQLRGRGSTPQLLQGSAHMDPVRAAGARGAVRRAPAARLMAPDVAAVQALRGGRWPVIAGPCVAARGDGVQRPHGGPPRYNDSSTLSLMRYYNVIVVNLL